jgi:hypothetical protein
MKKIGEIIDMIEMIEIDVVTERLITREVEQNDGVENVREAQIGELINVNVHGCRY